MERKGMMDKMGSCNRVDFIGRKCLKFLKRDEIIRNTVSIAPIIGRGSTIRETFSPGFGNGLTINNHNPG